MDNTRNFSKSTSTAIPQYTPCKVSGSTASAGTAGTEKLHGVAFKGATATASKLALQLTGITKCLVDGSGSAIAVGDDLMMGAGKLVKYVASTGNRPVARAEGASTADGDVIEITMYGYQPASA